MKQTGIIVLLAALILGACSVETGKGDKSPGKVKSMIVESGEITVKMEETGEIEPIREIELKPKVSGKIVKFYVDEGDYIEDGDLIADIEPDYNEAEKLSAVKSNLTLAQIRLTDAQKDLADAEELATKNYISDKQLRDARNELERATINHQDALNQNDLVKEIESKDNVSKMYASASGTIIERKVEEGEMVISSSGNYSGGTVIFNLADLSRMVVKSRINEVDIGKVHKKQKVKIQVDAFPYQKYNGNITRIAPKATSYNNVKVFQIEIEIIDVDEKLRPGMTANITIIGEKRADIVTIPIRAIFSDEDGQDIIYKVVNDTISNSVVVKTGINDFQKVEIIEGLAVGDTISFSEPRKEIPKVDFN